MTPPEASSWSLSEPGGELDPEPSVPARGLIVSSFLGAGDTEGSVGAPANSETPLTAVGCLLSHPTNWSVAANMAAAGMTKLVRAEMMVITASITVAAPHDLQIQYPGEP
jgi:hypothetical protein